MGPRPDADPVCRPRQLGYRQPALALSFAFIVLVVSFVIFFFFAIDYFTPKQHDDGSRQNTSTAAQTR